MVLRRSSHPWWCSSTDRTCSGTPPKCLANSSRHAERSDAWPLNELMPLTCTHTSGWLFCGKTNHEVHRNHAQIRRHMHILPQGSTLLCRCSPDFAGATPAPYLAHALPQVLQAGSAHIHGRRACSVRHQEGHGDVLAVAVGIYILQHSRRHQLRVCRQPVPVQERTL
jgi:hypothetical protein